MAKKRNVSRQKQEKAKGGFDLNKDDEDKVMLFEAGMVFSLAVSASLVGLLFYGLLSGLAVIIVLAMIERRHAVRQ